MSRYFITGATGFLGAYLTQQIFENESAPKVKALKRASSQIPDLLSTYNIEWVDGDLLDVIFLDEAMQGVDYVIHGAAKVSFLAKDREEMRQTNITGTANMVNAALSHPIKCFCQISSVAALGMAKPSNKSDKKEDKRINEKARWTPEFTEYTAYAYTKHLSEREVWRVMAEGLPALIVNPSFVLGYEKSGRSSMALIDYLLDEKPYYGRGWSNFVDVRDVAEMTYKLLQNEENYGERYILNADTRPFSEMMPILSKALGKKPPQKPIPKWVERFGWRVLNLGSKIIGKDPIITKDALEAANRRVSYSNQKIKETLETDFRSLEQTADWVAEQVSLADKK